MEVTQIRYFLALCREGSFTRAARRCGVAQPSLTRAIKKLERELGTSLFRRHPAGAALTPDGERLVPYFKVILRCISEVERERWRRPGQRSTEDILRMLGFSTKTNGSSSAHQDR
jgi:DNA-binding transcriptional LysR family regulator